MQILFHRFYILLTTLSAIGPDLLTHLASRIYNVFKKDKAFASVVYMYPLVPLWVPLAVIYNPFGLS